VDEPSRLRVLTTGLEAIDVAAERDERVFRFDEEKIRGLSGGSAAATNLSSLLTCN
jgi:hypothetical protein